MKSLVPHHRILACLCGFLLSLCLLTWSSPAHGEEARQHIVAAGETLSQIAAKYELTVEQLMVENGINDPNDLSVGQVLTLPDPNAPTPTPTPIIHIVQAGEALSVIAAAYDVLMEAIIEANDLAGPTDIQWGRELIIPTEMPTPVPGATWTATATGESTSIQTTTPTLIPTLIPTRKSTNTATVEPTATATATEIITQAPTATHTPTTPTSTPAGYEPVLHIVRPGETASGIAEVYGIELDELLAANAIDDANALVIGQQLVIPDVEPTATPVSESEVAPAEGDASELVSTNLAKVNQRIASLNQSYTVKYGGETLSYIALRLGVDAEALRAINQLASIKLLIEAGTELLLPATDRELYVPPDVPAAQLRTVAAGESLEGIAIENGLTLADLLYANRIGNADSVEAGQQIIIPPTDDEGAVQALTPQVGPGRSGYFFYTVRGGDTASLLAQKLNTSENAIVDYNDFPNLDTIFLGMEIRVPFGQPQLPVRMPPIPISGSSFVVSISRQQCWVFWGASVARTWNCSTGRGDNKTRLGNFAIQSKIEMARSRAYQLDMPFWLGIYNVGYYENGIHGLPIDLVTNKKIWTELIGEPATFGCAMLGDKDAGELFDIAYLGMPVYIIK